MKISQKQIAVRDLVGYQSTAEPKVTGYKDHGDAGVTGLNGKLNIRPPYQREFVYKDAQRDKVIDTVRKGYPLNVMYWVRNPDASAPEDDSLANFEVLDGQQRTLSLCKYVNGDFSIEEKYFHNLTSDQQDQVLDYKLTVYICEGTESEKLDWFRTINIAGEKLTEQELLNAVYTGPWLASAKAYFSKPNCAAYLMGSEYVTGSPIRQEYLELVLKWINGDNPEGYMAKHQHDKTAIELRNYFSSVIDWVKVTFPTVRKEMKHVPWGELYNAHKDEDLDPVALEAKIVALMEDEEITKKAGIYSYVLNGKERNLSLREFSDKIKRETYTKQGGLCANAACPKAGVKFKLEEMEADHIDPWHAGGRTIAANCQMRCKSCNRRKSGI